MNRYVDVEPLQKVTLAGRTIRAIPIRDRITIDGPVTTHFLSETGAYLGSEAADSGVAVIPSDEKTLRELWKDADLSRPAEAPVPPPRPTVSAAQQAPPSVAQPRRLPPGSTATDAASDPGQPRRITPVRRSTPAAK
jgi:hypothetical protein